MKTTPTLLALQMAVLLVAGCSSGVDEKAGTSKAERVSRTTSSGSSGYEQSLIEAVKALDEQEARPEAEIARESALPAVDDQDHTNLGRAAWERGDYEVAAQELKKAAELGNVSTYDRYLLGLALWKTGEIEDAEETLADATWKMEEFVRAPVNLARVRIETGDFKGAQTAIERALEIDPDFGPAHNVLGRILLARGDGDRAAEAFQKASELSPENPWPLNNLGYSLIVAGRAAEAVAPLEEAVSRREDLAVSWHNLALAREQMGDLAGATSAALLAVEHSESNVVFAATSERLAALSPPKGTDDDPSSDGSTIEIAEATVEQETIDLASSTDP